MSTKNKAIKRLTEKLQAGEVLSGNDAFLYRHFTKSVGLVMQNESEKLLISTVLAVCKMANKNNFDVSELAKQLDEFTELPYELAEIRLASDAEGFDYE